MIAESRTEIAEAYEFLLDLKDGWPEAMQNVKTCQLAQELLNTKKAYISDLRKTGRFVSIVTRLTIYVDAVNGCCP